MSSSMCRVSVIILVLLIVGDNALSSPVPAPGVLDNFRSLAKKAGNKVWYIGSKGKEIGRRGIAPVSNIVNKVVSVAKKGSKKVWNKIRESI